MGEGRGGAYCLIIRELGRGVCVCMLGELCMRCW